MLQRVMVFVFYVAHILADATHKALELIVAQPRCPRQMKQVCQALRRMRAKVQRSQQQKKNIKKKTTQKFYSNTYGKLF